MKYARIINNVAQEVVNFNPHGHFHPDVEALFDPVPDEVNQGATFEDGSWTPYTPPPDPEPDPEPPVVDPVEWLIDLGPFFDRFGEASMAIELSTDVVVQAILRDFNRRKWINLQDPRVAYAINIIISKEIEGVTPELRDTILSTPVDSGENMALRKLYFS